MSTFFKKAMAAPAARGFDRAASCTTRNRSLMSSGHVAAVLARAATPCRTASAS
jgi:hypothetical protein